MAVKLYHGDIVYTPSADALAVYENSYIAVDSGKVEGIYPVIPEKYKHAECIDYGRQMIIPAFSDLHVHGAQYVQRGIGMDCLLSDWLNNYTFPQESRFKDMDYAKQCYDAFVDDMLRHGTFHANVFATIHREATEYLFNRMEDTMEDSWVPLAAEERLERFCYIGDDRNIRARFIDGKEIHFEN